MGCSASIGNKKLLPGVKGGKACAETFSIEPYNQAHLFEGATEAEQKSLVQQLIKIDNELSGGGLANYLKRARKLLHEAQNDFNALDGFVPNVPVGERLIGDAGPGTDTFAAFEQLGMAELSKCCFCLVAGGLGERLGFPGIKIGITAELTTGATFFEKYARYILAFQTYARRTTGDQTLQLPLAIMTSGDTHAKTVEFLKLNNNFGLASEQITIMQQAKVPALQDPLARIAKDKNDPSKIVTKPHGHGDVHALLHDYGLPRKWEAEGRRWLVLFQDSNPLAFRGMCAVLGVSVKQDFVMNSVCVQRVPGEPVGAMVHLAGVDGSTKTINVEYHLLEALLRTTPVGGDCADETGYSPYPGNVNILVFEIPRLAARLETTRGIVPEFVNPKWADEERSTFKASTRLECMMQDFPLLCGPEDNIGFTQLERHMCFTCVKNNIKDAPSKNPHDCALTCEAAIYQSDLYILQLSGAEVEIEEPGPMTFMDITVQMGARVILQPSFCICLEELKSKVRGRIKISKRSSLVVDGNIVISDLELDGAMEVSGQGELKGQVVQNDGPQFEAVPADELPTLPPSLQIRGYRCSEGTVEFVSF